MRALIAFCTFSCVSGVTFASLFKTRDTVLNATPAFLATSRIVTGRFLRDAIRKLHHLVATRFGPQDGGLENNFTLNDFLNSSRERNDPCQGSCQAMRDFRCEIACQPRAARIQRIRKSQQIHGGPGSNHIVKKYQFVQPVKSAVGKNTNISTNTIYTSLAPMGWSAVSSQTALLCSFLYFVS